MFTGLQRILGPSHKPPGRCANLAPGARGALCTAQCLPRGKADQSPLNCVGRILAGLRSGKPPKANQTNERSLQRPTSGRNPAHTDLYGLGRPKPPKWPCEPTLYYRVVVARPRASGPSWIGGVFEFLRSGADFHIFRPRAPLGTGPPETLCMVCAAKELRCLAGITLVRLRLLSSRRLTSEVP